MVHEEITAEVMENEVVIHVPLNMHKCVFCQREARVGLANQPSSSSSKARRIVVDRYTSISFLVAWAPSGWTWVNELDRAVCPDCALPLVEAEKKAQEIRDEALRVAQAKVRP